jgi:hypothetical protein
MYDGDYMRECRGCSKEYDYAGFYCHWCSEKRREEKRKGIPCKSCNIVKGISNKTFHLCALCYRNKRENDDPIYKEKVRIAKFKSRRKSRGQDPNAPIMKRRNGEGSLDKNGYFQITRLGHPNCTSKTGRIAEHTFIMSEHLGRPLTKFESVHHKNGVRHDNKIENLELWHKGQPAGQRVEDKITWCKEFLSQYGYKVDKIKI